MKLNDNKVKKKTKQNTSIESNELYIIKLDEIHTILLSLFTCSSHYFLFFSFFFLYFSFSFAHLLSITCKWIISLFLIRVHTFVFLFLSSSMFNQNCNNNNNNSKIYLYKNIISISNCYLEIWFCSIFFTMLMLIATQQSNYASFRQKN